MKGISLPANMVVITVVVIAVLITLVYFFYSSSGSGITRSEATRVFFEYCSQLKCGTPGDVCMEVYRQSGHDTEFYNGFYSACETLYGGGRSNAMLCFASCGSCAKLTDAQKDYLINRGNDGLAVDLDSVLRRCASMP